MSLFSAAASLLHADPNISVAALYRVRGMGAAAEIRVIRTTLQPAQDVYQRVRAGNEQLRVLQADAPELGPGDTFEFPAQFGAFSEVLEVLDRSTDAEGTSWDVTLRRQ